MNKFEIHFSNNFEAYKLVYNERVSIRGKDSAAYQSSYSFQWTQAVKALSILVLRSMVYPSYVLEGETGSLASSLDYSISKNTHWISDLFGVDASGRSLAKKIFKRFNSDRSIKAPVGISLNRNYFENVEFFLENQSLELDQIITVLKSLEFNLGIENTLKLEDFDLKNYLIDIYEKEFRDSIFRTDIFSDNSIKNNINLVRKAGLYKKISGLDFNIEDSKLSKQGQLGLGLNFAKTKKILNGINIHAPTALVGAVILFKYLKKDYSIKLSYDYPHAVEMINALISGEIKEEPDLICSGIAPAATLMSSKLAKDYSILMFLPDISQKVVAHKNAVGKRKSTLKYSYLKEDPSIPSFMIEELVEMGAVSKHKVKLQHDEPDNSFNLLQSGDAELRAALFFPHYNFNCDLNNCLVLPDPRAKLSCQEVVLFVHKSKLKDKAFIQTVEAVIRDAWLEMRTMPGLIKSEISSLFNDEQKYFKSVVRYGGLHHKLLAN